MRKLLLMAMFLLSTVAIFAQGEKKDYSAMSNEEFFIGNWKLFVEGLPTGDADMLLVIKKGEDGKLEGTIGGMDGSGTNKLTKIAIDDKTIQVNFLGGGYDVPIYLDREKDGTITGSMNDMFDCTGTRIEDKK